APGGAGDTRGCALVREGVRELALSAGIERGELAGLIGALAAVGGDLGEREDDAVSALWDLDLQHVHYAARDAVLSVAGAHGGTHARAERVQALVTAALRAG